MGCAASKLDNEDTVRRCKERRRLMTESVKARHHLAAAHADYCRSLRLTGSALSSFAAGESLAVSSQTPAVFLHPPRVPPSPAPSSVYNPPPPPPVSVPPSTRGGASSVASSNLSRRRKKPPQQQRKLPHILSSPSSSPKSERSNFMPNSNFYPSAYQNSNYSASPSQASSVWNWENFYPPSPPDSEFFNRKAQERQQQNRFDDGDGDDTGTERSEIEFNHFRKQKKQIESMEEETEREEVQCSEWDDHGHYSTTSSSDAEEEEGDRESVSEIGARSDFGSMRSSSMRRQAKPVPQEEYREEKFRKRDDDAMSYRSGASDMKMVVRHRDLKEIVDAIQENFDKAASSGDQVSQMLHLGKAQLDRNFSQLKSEF